MKILNFKDSDVDMPKGIEHYWFYFLLMLDFSSRSLGKTQQVKKNSGILILKFIRMFITNKNALGSYKIVNQKLIRITNYWIEWLQDWERSNCS